MLIAVGDKGGGEQGKKKKGGGEESWSSAQSLGTDCAGQKSRGRNSGNESRRAKGGERK